MTTKRWGFTLIELLVVATIIAVLSTVAVVSYTNITKKSRDSKRIGDLEQIRSALEMYRADMGHYPYPNTDSWVNASELEDDLVDNGYMASIPTDPQVRAYQYQVTGAAVLGNYYGYCISAYVEQTSLAKNDCGGSVTLPTYDGKTNNYGLKNP